MLAELADWNPRTGLSILLSGEKLINVLTRDKIPYISKTKQVGAPSEARHQLDMAQTTVFFGSCLCGSIQFKIEDELKLWVFFILYFWSFVLIYWAGKNHALSLLELPKANWMCFPTKYRICRCGEWRLFVHIMNWGSIQVNWTLFVASYMYDLNLSFLGGENHPRRG